MRSAYHIDGTWTAPAKTPRDGNGPSGTGRDLGHRHRDRCPEPGQITNPTSGTLRGRVLR